MPERDAKGRFVKGHSGGPGRPPRRIERDYLDALKAEVTLDRWLMVVRRALADAIQGDSRAREWLSNYLVGRPPHIIELNAADAALLSDVLAALPENVSAATVFEAMLIELSAEQEPADLTDAELLRIAGGDHEAP
jgi:hypothetical protein